MIEIFQLNHLNVFFFCLCNMLLFIIYSIFFFNRQDWLIKKKISYFVVFCLQMYATALNNVRSI